MQTFKSTRRWVAVFAVAIAVLPAVANADPCTSGPLAYAPECQLYPDMDAAHQQGLQEEANSLAALPVEPQIDVFPEDPATALSSGIFTAKEDLGQPPVPRDLFAAVNAWTGLNALTTTSVWAGVNPTDRTIGMIVVGTYDATGSYLERVKAITAPGVTGALKITSSLFGGLGGGLTLVGSTAGTFLYDFVLDKLVPTP